MKQFVDELEEGDGVDSVFSVRHKEPVREYRNGYTFTLGISDRTGETRLKFWGGEDEEEIEEIHGEIGIGDVIRVTGRVSSFRDEEYVSVNEDEDELEITGDYEIEDFVPTSSRDPEAMLGDLEDEVEKLDSRHIRKLIRSFLEDGDFRESYKRTPAGSHYHHPYIGGLLEHTLSMIETCRALGESHEGLDWDLLVAGCFLHGIGKVREFDVTTHIARTEEGLLRGHISLGTEMLAEKLGDFPDFPEELEAKLHHLILSHKGEREYGATVEPSFPEAVAVHQADRTNTKMEEYLRVRREMDTEDWQGYSDRFGKMYMK